MIYQQLFDALPTDRTVRTGIIGTGHFARAIITQAQAIRRLTVPVVCDLNVEAARDSLEQAGLPESDIVICSSRTQALAALERGQWVILSDALLMMDLPLDVIVESTGAPEAAARHATAAIDHGKHVAMVSKEADVVVGPILRQRASQAGLVYTAVDGDQHGLLIALVQRARLLGLEVLAGGKGLEADLIYDDINGAIAFRQETRQLSPKERVYFRSGPPAESLGYVQRRREILGPLGQAAGFDLVEMGIVANATGLAPDIETLHGLPLRIPEIPEVLAPRSEGGLLNRRGVIDCVACLRQPYEAGLGGGVFIVVGCENDYSRHVLFSKGLIGNSRETTALIYRPYHLCGVETPLSLLAAGLLGQPTAAIDYRPRYDVLARAAVDLEAGQPLGDDHSPTLQALLQPARAVGPGVPLPLHMAAGHRLAVDVPAGTVITTEMVQRPAQSALWSLRAEQDAYYFFARPNG